MGLLRTPRAEQAEEQTAEQASSKAEAAASESRCAAAVDEPAPHDLTSADMVAVTAVCPKGSHDELASYASKAEQLVKRTCQMVPFLGNQPRTLSHMIKSTTVGKLAGTMSEPIGIVYDHKVAGESATKPSVRPPPLIEEQLKAAV